MTTVKITFDPYLEKVTFSFDGHIVSSEISKLNSFLAEHGFVTALTPVRTRYMVWRGLLPELINECNDDELQIVFEGTEADFQQVKAAFSASTGAVLALGYQNRWELAFCDRFGADHLRNQLIAEAKNLRELCETRSQLTALQNYIKLASDRSAAENFRILQALVQEQRMLWENSSNKYKESKLSYIETVSGRLETLLPYIRAGKEKEDAAL